MPRPRKDLGGVSRPCSRSSLILLALRELFPRLLLTYVALLVLFGLVCLSRLIASWWRQLCREASGDPKGQGSVGHQGAPRVKVPPSIYKKPDPLIYSQSYLMSLGLGVTWDNPDVHLELGGVAVPSHDLQPATTYGVKANIWNSSMEAPAVNLLVRFYYLSFGIGAARTFIGETHVDLAVKGSPMLPAVANASTGSLRRRPATIACRSSWYGRTMRIQRTIWGSTTPTLSSSTRRTPRSNSCCAMTRSSGATTGWNLTATPFPRFPPVARRAIRERASIQGTAGQAIPFPTMSAYLRPVGHVTLGPNEEQLSPWRISVVGRALRALRSMCMRSLTARLPVTLYFHS